MAPLDRRLLARYREPPHPYNRSVQTIYKSALAALAIALLGAGPSGAHGFDFNFGSWHTHIKLLAHPFTGPQRWLTYDGTVNVRPVWNGAAGVEEIEASGPSRLEVLNVRMYDPRSGQWSLNGADSADGTLEAPMYGTFSNGRGTFYGQDAVDGRTVLIRQTFFDITRSSYDFQEALSDDGGTTWKPDFVAHLTRIAERAPSEGRQTVADTSHAFDFNYGTWSTHITASGAKLAGTVAVRKIWNGRALMEEIHASGAHGGFQGLTLFLYDPQSRQWSQTYADRSDATFERSMIGGFSNGRGVLTAFPSPNQGTMQCVRDVWSDIKPDSHHFEVQYSSDGCATWKPAFVADLHRIGPGL